MLLLPNHDVEVERVVSGCACNALLNTSFARPFGITFYPEILAFLA